jgi:RHS repeat-associated protein
VTCRGQTYYYHADGLGSITGLTDSSQTVVQNYGYDGFGNLSQTPTIQNPYTYTGREWDRETGLYYYRARYYDPKAGRFLSEDPIGIAGGIDLYAYARNNPVKFMDPMGLFTYNAGPPTTIALPFVTAMKVHDLETCLGIPLVVTGAAEPHSGGPNGPHGRGLAADFSFRANPQLPNMKAKFMCCAQKAGFAMGIEEGPPLYAPQYHVQVPPGRGNFRGELANPCPTGSGC